MDLLQNFRNKEIKREQLKCSDELAIWLDHCEYAIHTQFDKNNKMKYKFKKRKKQVDPNFRNAIQNFNREEKVQFYLRCMTHLENLNEGKDTPPTVTISQQKPIQGQCEARSFNLKMWKIKRIRLDQTRHEIMVEKDKKIKTYNLRHYLLRKSKIKDKDKNLIVLEAINDFPHQKSRTVHISFKNVEIYKKWYALIRDQVYFCQWLNVRDMFYNKNKIGYSVVTEFKQASNNSESNKLYNSQTSPVGTKNTQIQSSSSSQISQKSPNNTQLQEKIQNEQQNLNKQEEQLMGRRKTFIEHLVNDDGTDFQELFDEMENQTPTDVEQKRNLDFFHKLMPDYELSDVRELVGYQNLVNQDNFKIYQSLKNLFRFKICITFTGTAYSSEKVLTLISDPKLSKNINEDISQQSIKTMVKSENSAIVYQANKAYNKFYRLRDFIFIRHVFSHKGHAYMVDKSIDNMNYPPFITLVRGDMTGVWGVFPQNTKEEKKIQLVGDIVLHNAGLLNNQQQLNLSLKYLKGFKCLFTHPQLSNSKYQMFDLSWDIDNKELNLKIDEIRVRRKTIQLQRAKMQKVQEPIQNSLNNGFKKKQISSYQQITSSPEKRTVKQKEIQSSSQESFKEIPQFQLPQSQILSKQASKQSQQPILLKTQIVVKRILDAQGLVVIDKAFVRKKYLTSPIQKPEKYRDLPKIKGHAIWKGDWVHDKKNGGIIFINQKKIQDQKGVLKFILTKIGKNILSGKSVLNISLPVDIFAPQSNLERLLLSMAYGPKYLENLQGKNSLQKLINVFIFGLTNSVLYLNMEKPFNPILGQTFQCWINGCPGYGQQISHHPPIAALMFYGRGYRVTCQLQSKVQMHMNSGCGTNQGIYRVQFDDGTVICFITPGGQVSGLTYGDRKFNLVGKSYYWIQKERIFVEVTYDAGKKGFFAKQQNPADFFEGTVYEVNKQFFNTFPKNKKRIPTEKERLKELGKIQGIWNKYIKWNNKQIFNLDSSIPLQLEYEAQPLPSDANWREDIAYRRFDKITRAQAEKQRLQIVQRNDRKLRAKYHKK